MCDLCSHTAVRSASTSSPPARVLGLIGTQRRSAWHAGRRYKQPERVRAAEWRQVEAVKQEGDEPFARDLRRVFARERSAFLQGLRRLAGEQPRLLGLKRRPHAGIYGPQRPAVKVPLIVEAIFRFMGGLEEWKAETEAAAKAHIEAALERGHQTGQTRVGVSGIDFTSDDPSVRQVADEMMRLSGRVPQDTLAKRLGEDLQRGLSAGDDFAGLAGRVEQRFDDMESWKARQLARTGGNGSFERGQLEAFRDAGIDARSWLSERDSRVRDGRYNHREPDGQVQSMSDPFLVSGESLMFPTDPAGSVGNIVNCRCSQRPEFADALEPTRRFRWISL